MPSDAGLVAVPIANMENVVRYQIFPAVKRCYQHGLDTQRDQEGRILIAIKVEPEGAVSSSRALSNTGLTAEVEACALRAAKAARFGCNPGGVVQVPFNLVHQGRPAPAPLDASAP